ncbi:hypothetical protein, partial [Staphylococcus nepalensis]|uniref:hypothetical protein n=1 Tax=Staphylococcus nepalensis TaxID=214473 RepID=UPI00286427AF
EFVVKNQRIEKYRDLALKLMKEFSFIEVDQHPRSTNAHADALATLASAIPSELQRSVLVEFIANPSIESEMVQVRVCMAEVSLG